MFAIDKGKFAPYNFKVQGKGIPTIQDESIKYLGKWFHQSLRDIPIIKEVQTELRRWFHVSDQCKLLGHFKVWRFQCGIIPRVQWTFLLYDISITTVKNMERQCRKFPRKWLGVPTSFCAVKLYSTSAKLRLPVSSIIEEFKTDKVRAIVTLQQSKDPVVQNTMQTERSGEHNVC